MLSRRRTKTERKEAAEQIRQAAARGMIDGPVDGRTRPGLLTFAGAAGLGASLMYFLDPDRGARRRKLIEDKVVHAGHVAGEGMEKAARDLRNRATGAAASARHRLMPDPADDRVIAERIRAELGRVVSHPSAIEVLVEEGTAILSGPVLAREVHRLLGRTRKVRGVKHVENQLDIHETAEGVPALQGGIPRTGGEFELRQENWTPAARLLTTAAGGAMAFYGARQRGPMGAVVGLAGLALAARGATNKQIKRLVGVGGGRKAVDIQKTINIDAPRDRVFAFITDYQNWPRWMSHVREVRETQPGLQHWVIDGPAGKDVEWDAEVTRFIPDELVSWKSVDGAAVRHAGVLRVDENAEGGTRVHIQMSYNPPAGAAGHALARLFRADPKRQMDEDLQRLKTTIETGTPPHDAAVRSGSAAPIAEAAGEEARAPMF